MVNVDRVEAAAFVLTDATAKLSILSSLSWRDLLEQVLLVNRFRGCGGLRNDRLARRSG